MLKLVGLVNIGVEIWDFVLGVIGSFCRVLSWDYYGLIYVLIFLIVKLRMDVGVRGW